MLSVLLVVIFTNAPAHADPADDMIADCSDNGAIDATHSRQAIDTALQRIYGNSTDEPFGGCTPELWRLLDLTLEDAGGPVRDCFANGRIDGVYSRGLIEDARGLLPAVSDEFFPTCDSVLAEAQQDAESMSGAASPISRATAIRYAERHGRKVARRSSKVSARVLLRRRASRWYAQVRWPATKRGVCYAEVIVKRLGSKVRTGTAGRWCSTDSP